MDIAFHRLIVGSLMVRKDGTSARAWLHFAMDASETLMRSVLTAVLAKEARVCVPVLVIVTTCMRYPGMIIIAICSLLVTVPTLLS